MPPIISKKISILYVLILSVVVSLTTYGILSLFDTHATAENTTAPRSCNYNVKRSSGFKYVKPIMWVDEECESEDLISTKQKLAEIITRYRKYEGVSMASVYLRSGTEWTVVNENEKYDPGSLFKVPVLITILKMEEKHPGFLNKVIRYDRLYQSDREVSYPSKSIQVGKSYTIKELLTYMIKYSDNAATILLDMNLDSKMMKKVFTDVGVEVPKEYASQYQFTAADYSLFMRTIVNAGYLSIEHSEFAAELLSECDFKDGIMKGVPANTKIAHKFGESGNATERQLHESALVYLDNKGYLLTVMTKGKDMAKLSDLIGEISRTVYTDIKNKS